MVFLSNMFGIALTLGAKKIFAETQFKEMCNGTENKSCQFKVIYGKTILQGKDFWKRIFNEKIPDRTQKETKQDTDNIKDKLYMKINIHS